MNRAPLAVTLLLCVAARCTLSADEPWVLGLEELHRLDRLPLSKPSVRVASVSSYDRSGGNDDGFSGKYSFVGKEDGALVIADLKGPGIIYRIWTPTPTDDTLEFRFDGETAPRIEVKFRDLFTGARFPFVSPLVGYGAGGFWCYVPLPFRKACKVLVRSDSVQFYQLNYAVYPNDAPVKTWEARPADEYLAQQKKVASLFSSPGSDISASVVPEGSRLEVARREVSLEPGGRATLFETRTPGRIAAIRIAPAAALAGKRRDLVLRIYWDDEARPAVLSPAGDFFGYAWGRPATASLLVGTAGDVSYSYFPMPFDKAAKIELVSERSEGPPVDLRAEVAFAPVPRSPAEGKFYALWRRENPTATGAPFTFIETRGSGHLVGCILQAQGLASGNTYFFEGDDQTWIDGELAIHGTGSEDFFNGGWYDVPGRWEKRLSFPLSGCLGYRKHLGRTGGYRLLLGDAYAFRGEIRHVIEHAPTENKLPTDYCALTFLYSKGRPTCDFALPPLPERRVVDFKKVVYTPGWSVPIHAFTFRNATLSKRDEELAGGKVRFLSMEAEGQDWFGHPFLSLVCDIPARGMYSISVEAVKGPSQARVQLFKNEGPAGSAADFYSQRRELSEPTPLGVLRLDEGPNNLMFKLVGKNSESRGLRFDLSKIFCQRVE